MSRLRRHLLAGLLLATSCGTNVWSQAPAEIIENPESEAQEAGSGSASFTLSVDVDLVELQVAAIDNEGRRITTLDEDDFVISEDRVPQRISLFRQYDLPVSLGLVIDNSRSMTRKKDRVDTAALSFVSHNNPDDEAFLINFDDTARITQDFTINPEPIRGTLEERVPYGQTALYDAVSLALKTMERGVYDQKALLVISDGADNASTHDFETVLDEVRQSDATVYTIGVFTNYAASAEAEHVMKALAEAGGGRAFFPESADEVPALTEQIAQEIRDQYTIGYIPTNFQRDGSWRSVRVDLVPEADAHDIELTYRHGYYAPNE